MREELQGARLRHFPLKGVSFRKKQFDASCTLGLRLGDRGGQQSSINKTTRPGTFNSECMAKYVAEEKKNEGCQRVPV